MCKCLKNLCKCLKNLCKCLKNLCKCLKNLCKCLKNLSLRIETDPASERFCYMLYRQVASRWFFIYIGDTKILMVNAHPILHNRQLVVVKQRIDSSLEVEWNVIQYVEKVLIFSAIQWVNAALVSSQMCNVPMVTSNLYFSRSSFISQCKMKVNNFVTLAFSS